MGVEEKMAKKRKQKLRNWYKYDYTKNRRIIHSGITTDLERREKEHQNTYGGGRIKQVGRRTTEEAARAWEEKKKKA